jgi:hypothetical protein
LTAGNLSRTHHVLDDDLSQGELTAPVQRRWPMKRALVRTLILVAATASSPLLAGEIQSLFDGRTLKGWEGETKLTWRVEEGAIVGGSLTKAVPRNEFLATDRTYSDFELTVTFKLLGDRKHANAGIQFRSKRVTNHHEVYGYQADIGQHYWGALYDESRRNRILAPPKPAALEKQFKHEAWNTYVIRCEGARIRLWLNGNLTVDYTEADTRIERTGIIALQIHGGAKAKVYFKDIAIKELAKSG